MQNELELRILALETLIAALTERLEWVERSTEDIQDRFESMREVLDELEEW